MDLIETKRTGKHYLRMTTNEYKDYLENNNLAPRGMIICIITNGRKRKRRNKR